MDLPNIDRYIAASAREDDEVILLVEPSAFGYTARLATSSSRPRTLLCSQGDRYMSANGDSPSEALEELELIVR
jgi:hypothetical protein